jgi:hypothetical protein
LQYYPGLEATMTHKFDFAWNPERHGHTSNFGNTELMIFEKKKY